MRGRNPNRKGPNPLTRSYESNGPDVKIRGTAHHVAEKYLQLARDAQSSGDPVAAESYLQHAEHYFRLIASAQQAQAQAQMGYVRTAADMENDDDDDDGYDGLPDRFASPVERTPVIAAPQPYGERPAYNNNGGDRPPQQHGGGERPNYNGGNNFNGERPHNSDRGNYERPDRPDRPQGQDRGDRQNNDRPQARDDRPYNNGNGNNADRHGRDRNNMNRNQRLQRDHQPRGDFQSNRDPALAEQPVVRDAPREPAYQAPVEARRDPQPDMRAMEPAPQPEIRPVAPAPASDAGAALPAFITAPTRTAAPAPVESPSAPVSSAPPAAADFPSQEGGEVFPVRTRRRRRTRAEIDADEAAARNGEPVSK
jgi:hypothetical protein